MGFLIHDPNYPPPDIQASPVTARVDAIELMSNEVFVHLSTESTTFLARLDPRTQARPGQDIQIVLNMSAMHAFDVDTGATLLS